MTTAPAPAPEQAEENYRLGGEVVDFTGWNKRANMAVPDIDDLAAGIACVMCAKAFFPAGAECEGCGAFFDEHAAHGHVEVVVRDAEGDLHMMGRMSRRH